MNLATEQQNSKAAEIGGVIRLAHAMKAAALSAPTAIAAQAILENLKALSLEAGNIDPSGQIAKMIYNFTQDAYKRVEQLAMEEAAAQSSREGIMGDPVKHAFRKDEKNVAVVADFLKRNGLTPPNVMQAIEATNPDSIRKLIAFDEGGKATDKTIDGKRMRENLVILQATINEDKLDPAAIKARNMILYGREEGPRNATERKTGSARVQQAYEEIIGVSAHKKREQAGEDPAKREKAVQEAKREIDQSRASVNRIDDLETRIARFEENPPRDKISQLAHEAVKTELHSAKRDRNNSFASACDESANDILGVTPSHQQEQETRIKLAENQDNSPATRSPLPADAPALASAGKVR